MADNYVIRPEFLENTFSFFGNGKPASLRDCIAATGSSFVLEDFGIAAKKATIRPLISLRNKARKAITLSELKAQQAINPNQQMPVTGFGSYTPAQLIDAVTRGTALGQKTIEGVMLQAMFIETKINRGHVRPSVDLKPVRQPG